VRSPGQRRTRHVRASHARAAHRSILSHWNRDKIFTPGAQRSTFGPGC
jgi:hypothetical protein